MFTWKHPKHYEELRRIRKQEEGSRPQASSGKLEEQQAKASSGKQQAATNCRSDKMTQEP
jgi:hypothetical protein